MRFNNAIIPRGFFRGYWCLIGGLVEPGESTDDAAKREVNEELAVS